MHRLASAGAGTGELGRGVEGARWSVWGAIECQALRRPRAQRRNPPPTVPCSTLQAHDTAIDMLFFASTRHSIRYALVSIRLHI